MGVAWSRGAGERKKGEREGAKRKELERGEDMKIKVFWGELKSFYRVCSGGQGRRQEGERKKDCKETAEINRLRCYSEVLTVFFFSFW